MAKKARNGQTAYRKGDLWIAPTSSLKPKSHQSDWNLQRGGPEEGNKYLELADIALGLAPAKPRLKRGA